MAGRRMNGEGSIYQRKDTGRWFGSVTVGFEDGGIVRKTVSARTKDEVRQKLKVLQKQLDDGLPPPDDTVTVKQLLADWQTKILRHQVQPSALDNYKSIAGHHIVPTLGRKKLSKLTPADVDNLLSAKLDEGLAVTSAGLAALALALARLIDDPANSATSKSMCAGRLLDTEGHPRKPRRLRDTRKERR